MKRSFVFVAMLLFLFLCTLSYADRIEYFEYTACYMDVPIREHPSPHARQIGKTKGETVRVSDQRGYWVKVVYFLPSGRELLYRLECLNCDVSCKEMNKN